MVNNKHDTTSYENCGYQHEILMDVHGNKIDFSSAPKGWKTPKLNNLIRISSRKTVLMDNYVICNNSSHD